jgi:hypothetical protein
MRFLQHGLRSAARVLADASDGELGIRGERHVTDPAGWPGWPGFVVEPDAQGVAKNLEARAVPRTTAALSAWIYGMLQGPRY